MKLKVWLISLIVVAALAPGAYAAQTLAIGPVDAVQATVPQAEGTGPTLTVASNDALGSFLADANGMTLYLFTKDEPGKSNCYGQCATNWAPLLVPEGQTPTAAEGITGQLGTTQRDDGTLQVTYDGSPLYYWIKDMAPGDATGQDVGGVWFVLPVDQTMTLNIGSNDALGSFLVGANGMTLYLFTKDEPGKSNCYDQCATNWPPLLVPEGQTPTAAEGITGQLGTTQRDDGTLQVTYDGSPLYYWIKDMAPGDATGQDVGGVWFVVAP